MSSSESESEGVAPGGVWPSSLTLGQTEDLARFGLYVPPSVKVPRPWRISADGYPTQCPPATREELRAHPGGRYNRRNRRHFWNGKRFDDVIRAFKRAAQGLPADATGGAGPSRPRRRAPVPTPAPAPPTPTDVPIPPEQAALHQDGDPEDTPGLLAALARSAEEAAAAVALEAQEQAAALEAVGVVVAAEQSDEEDWDDDEVLGGADGDDGGDNGGDGGDDDDDDGGDDGGMVEVIDLAMESDEE